MPVGNFVLDKGYAPAVQLSKYRAVKLSGNPEEVTPVVASTDIPLGVAQFGVLTSEITRGKQASVRVIGITPWECGAAVAIGQEVMADASGRCIPATGTGNRVKGLCVDDPTSVAGDYASVLLYNPAYIHA